ncbi:MAG: hypothetical protein O3C10_13625, partial [Chloroflexi bacterium]|nr:hypothetical protein [Chloroflexota bacterium]
RRGGVDRGHAAELRAFFDAVRKGGEWPVSPQEIDDVMRATFAIGESLQRRRPVDLRAPIAADQFN